VIPFLTATGLRVAAVAVLATAIAVMVWRVVVWHGAYEALPGVEAALEAEKLCGEGSACAARVAALEAAQQEVSKQVVSDYERELADLRNRPIPVRTVRLCPDRGAVRGAGSAGPADGTGAAADVVPGAAGPDIGPELYQLARDADEISARLRSLQQWNAALSAPPSAQ
jgi:hypothetical protein